MKPSDRILIGVMLPSEEDPRDDAQDQARQKTLEEKLIAAPGKDGTAAPALI